MLDKCFLKAWGDGLQMWPLYVSCFCGRNFLVADLGEVSHAGWSGDGDASPTQDQRVLSAKLLSWQLYSKANVLL
jgi:hypothetical protein